MTDSLFFFCVQNNTAATPRFTFNNIRQAHSQTPVCKRFAFDFVFIITEIKLYAFEGYGQQFLGKIILHSFS